MHTGFGDHLHRSGHGMASRRGGLSLHDFAVSQPSNSRIQRSWSMCTGQVPVIRETSFVQNRELRREGIDRKQPVAFAAVDATQHPSGTVQVI
jgi:hypothetical protein